MSRIIEYVKEVVESPIASKIVSKIVFDIKHKYAILYLKVASEDDLGEAKKLFDSAQKYGLLPSMSIAKRFIVVREIH
jgi:hypothetical protein